MTPHLSEEQVALYRDRSLAAAELLRASHHLAECETCRVRMASPSELHAGAEAFRVILEGEAANPPHLTYHEIAAYVDRQLSGEDAAQVEHHARECRSCAAEVAGIEALSRELGVSRKSPGWFDRISRAWRETFAWKGAFVLAGAAACALLVLLVVRKPMPEVPNQQASAPPQQPRQVAGMQDGKRVIAIAPGGTVTGLEGLPASLRASLAQAITTQRLEAPAVLADLSGKSSVLLGPSTAPSGVKLVGPVGIVVETQRPTFRWKPVAGAEYRVGVYSDSYEEVATSGWVHSAEWQVAKALQRGARYRWQLSVRHSGPEFTLPAPPAPEARFRILDAAGEAEITQLKMGGAVTHLLLGIGYAQLGALDDADRELRQAREQNPQSATVAALLASVEHLQIPKP